MESGWNAAGGRRDARTHVPSPAQTHGTQAGMDCAHTRYKIQDTGRWMLEGQRGTLGPRARPAGSRGEPGEGRISAHRSREEAGNVREAVRCGWAGIPARARETNDHRGNVANRGDARKSQDSRAWRAGHSVAHARAGRRGPVREGLCGEGRSCRGPWAHWGRGELGRWERHARAGRARTAGGGLVRGRVPTPYAYCTRKVRRTQN